MESADRFSALFKKYDVPVPRYTSYPTVPTWNGQLTTSIWFNHLRETLSSESPWSLYIHLPFCETLCAFCACNNVITQDHAKETDYLKILAKEWQLYLSSVEAISEAPLSQVHLGGGSPTFFSPQNLSSILEPIFKSTRQDPTAVHSVEVDPRRCHREQLEVLRDFGFSRASIGIQDFDESVQINVRRLQPLTLVERVLNWARQLNYSSINFDLIYGLPGQTAKSIKATAEQTLKLKPDRIALYSLAVVPWLKAGQKRLTTMEIPQGEAKRELYEIARGVFLAAGYIELGMDHFALPTDSLSLAYAQKKMHRNFMGYTENATSHLIGLGVSSISECPKSFHQNHKVIKEYYSDLEQGRLPTLRGHIQTKTDAHVRRLILDMMTKYQTKFESDYFNMHALEELEADELVWRDSENIGVTEKGRPFLRNICAAMDQYLNQNPSSTPRYSRI